jgi:YHS domain-containing protein
MISHPSQSFPRAAIAWMTFFWACLAVPDSRAWHCAEEADSILWRDDYAAALDEAKTADRLLWIQFTGPWCPNCTRMERDSFPAPAVVQRAGESFIPLKIRSDVYEQLAESLNLTGIPASIVVAPNLEVVAMQQGYLGPAELDAFLNDALARNPGARTGANSQTKGRKTTPGPRERSSEPRGEPEPKLSLLGFCPVSLVRDRKLVPGVAEFAVERAGRVYRFARPALANEFRKAPDRFIPRNDGACPVTLVDRGQKMAGNPKWGVIYRDRLFLCASAQARRQFVNSPERYATVEVAEKDVCRR